ncbi:MAG: recombination regulator RecX [Lachnospiraceae bacterium]|nr:recombination regulator RecX [Lachnospiraceae bacterium]
MTVCEIIYLEKGKYRVVFDRADELIMYRSELKESCLEEGGFLSDDKYDDLICNVIGKRATKRAMHILEKRDKTEKQLRDKLKENSYPDKSIDIAIDYVKSFGYLDDERYCYNYISYRIEKQSAYKLKSALLLKGIDKTIIESVYEELNDSSYAVEQIASLLEKKHFFDYINDSDKKNKIIQSIMRKGYGYSQILDVIKNCKKNQDIGDEIL